ncbi:reverse transcriptase domain-containing protein [Tanacetum coccineum]
MRTRSQQQQQQQQQVPPNLVEPPKDTMADNRTMAELLQAPTEGYEDAIVVPEIEAANFEIKHGLLTLVQNKQFFGHDKEDPHAHIRYFNKITSTLRYPNVPTTSIKLMLFPFSLEGAARIWLEKEPPRSIQTWDDLVAKFINQFFPPSKTTNLRNEITNFKQRFDESFTPDEDKEVNYEILDTKYPIIEWKTEYLGTKPQVDKAKHLEEINQNVVIRSNGQKRHFSTLMRVLSIFDRDDLNAIYQLVMDIYQDEIPEGFDRVLWGDLMIMFNPDDEDKFWNSQQDWNVISWKLHGSSGVHTLMTEAGLVIHMLVEKKYHLRKKVLLQILELKLGFEEDSTMALELIIFFKKLVAKLEPEDSDGDEEDL